MKTIDSLGIFWTSKSNITGEIETCEVSGLIFYGYWLSCCPILVLQDLDSFLEIFGRDNIEAKLVSWEGEDNSNYSIDVRIKNWGNIKNWIGCVESASRWFADRGAMISWAGTEYSSPSVNVFDPESFAGNIYAACSRGGMFFCNSDLDAEYQYVTSEQLVEIFSMK